MRVGYASVVRGCLAAMVACRLAGGATASQQSSNKPARNSRGVAQSDSASVAPAMPVAAVVRIDNPAQVSADRLQLAEERATEVFRRIDVRLAWIDTDTAIREAVAPYTVVVLAVPSRGSGRGGLLSMDDVLGVAAPAARRAYVYFDRVAGMRIGSPRTVDSILGDVIAHELGHLMLPPPGHSATGIMRPNVSFDGSAIETFNGAQARQIRSRLLRER
jgi:hypothetical protein